MKKVLIMAGGTGGHVFPALAVAKVMQEKGIAVHWIGTRRGLESDLVPKANIPISYIKISSLRGSKSSRWLIAPFAILSALQQTYRIIKQQDPDVVLGLGGYVSGPGGIAAWLLKKPLVIHEQNALAGFTNRILAWFAKTILEAFPGTFKSVRKKVITVGNPTRLEIANLPPIAQRMHERAAEKINLLILGGSQGALALNQKLPNAISILPPTQRPAIWQQTGKGRLDETRRMYQVLGLNARLEIFIDNMAEAYAWADLIVCRAGASTVAELMAAGVASILIPYPHSVDHHQLVNAEYLEAASAAIVLPQSEMSSARLAELLQQLCADRNTLLMMGENARKLYHANVAEKVVEICMQVANKPLNGNAKVEEN